jgi:dolichyl-phosphate-mannose--protein O-mannosyl transferase
MKRVAVLAVFATLLASCSTAGSLRNGKPTAAYQGSGSVQDIASCISEAWSSKPVHLKSYVLYTGTTIEIHKTETGPALALVDIKPVSDRTVATYYSAFDEDDTWYFQEIEHCMNTTLPSD